MKVAVGEEVKWKSLASDHWFKGKVKRVVLDTAIIDDRSGLSYRRVPMDRVELVVPRRSRFAGRLG